jgi:methyl-accepting chemotaxis protein
MPPRKKKKQPVNLETLSMRATQWIGTPQSIVVHSLLFAGIFLLRLFGVDIDSILLILTTAVSLEAIYLAIFIQMTVNKNTQSLADVEEDIEDIQEDFEDFSEDFEDLSEEVEDISEDIDKMQVNEAQEEKQEAHTQESLDAIVQQLQQMLKDIEQLKKTSAENHANRQTNHNLVH